MLEHKGALPCPDLLRQGGVWEGGLFMPQLPSFVVVLCESPRQPPSSSVAGTDGSLLSHHFLLGPLPSLMLSGDFPGLP